MFKQSFHFKSLWFGRIIKQNKNDNSRDQQAQGWCFTILHVTHPANIFVVWIEWINNADIGFSFFTFCSIDIFIIAM